MFSLIPESFWFKINLTSTLSGFETFYNPTSIIQNYIGWLWLKLKRIFPGYLLMSRKSDYWKKNRFDRTWLCERHRIKFIMVFWAVDRLNVPKWKFGFDFWIPDCGLHLNPVQWFDQKFGTGISLWSTCHDTLKVIYRKNSTWMIICPK